MLKTKEKHWFYPSPKQVLVAWDVATNCKIPPFAPEVIFLKLGFFDRFYPSPEQVLVAWDVATNYKIPPFAPEVIFLKPGLPHFCE
jgi:hypothetical protein